MSVSPISQAPSILLPLVQKAAQPVVAADPDHDGDVDGAGADNDSGKSVNIKA